MRTARVTLATVACGVMVALAGPDTTITASIQADAPVPGGATTAQWAGGRQPTPPQPV